MFRDEVKDKVKAYWNSHPQEKEEHKRKFMEGHSRLRKDKPTKLEDKLCKILSDLHLEFEPQAIIKDKFIVDIRIGKIIIQADGDYWHGHPRFEPLTDRQKAQQKRDKAQDKYLVACGYTVIRIWESDMSHHLVESLLNRYSTS
jgi:very-short-patch-repair endonuclease